MGKNRNRGGSAPATTLHAAAESGGGKAVENQGGEGENGDEKNSDPSFAKASEDEKGPDNNKRLAFLEERNVALGGAFMKHAEFFAAHDEEPISAAIRFVEEAAKQNEHLKGQIELVATALLARDGFAPLADEGACGSAVRVLGELDARVKALAAAEQGQHERADKSEARVAELEAELEAVRSNATVLLDVVEAVANGTADAGAVAAREDFETAVAIEAAVSGSLSPDLVYVIRAADADTFIPSIPPIEARAGDFEAAGERSLYLHRIPLDEKAPPATVTAFWLLAYSAAEPGELAELALAVRCEVPGGIRTGGGAMAMIPPGHLIF